MLKNFFYRRLSTICFTVVAVLICYAIPSVRNLRGEIVGSARLVLFGCILLVTFAYLLLKDFVKALTGVVNCGAVGVVADRIVFMQLIPLAICITGHLLPDKVTHSSGAAGVLMMLVIGIALGLDNLVRTRVNVKNVGE